MAIFRVSYNPEAPFNPKGRYCLMETEDRSKAVQAAEEYGQQYYGEQSPIWVHEGRKKIHTVPAGRFQ